MKVKCDGCKRMVDATVGFGERKRELCLKCFDDAMRSVGDHMRKLRQAMMGKAKK